mgnify:CR=1 FL=1
MIDSIDWSEVFYDSSRECIDRAVNFIEENPIYFDSLFEISLTENGVISQRAARTVSYLIIRNPDYFYKYSVIILQNLSHLKNESKTFTFMKIFTEIPLEFDEDLRTVLFNFCFSTLNRVYKKKAIKAYSVAIITRLLEYEPDLRNEMEDMMMMLEENAPMSLKCKIRRFFQSIDE